MSSAVLWGLLILLTYRFMVNCIGLIDPLYHTVHKAKAVKKQMEYLEEQFNFLKRGEKIWAHKIYSVITLIVLGFWISALLKVLNVI